MSRPQASTPNTWRVEWDERARDEYLKLDFEVQKDIARFLTARIETAEDPRRFGKALTARFRHLWCYRVGAYRIIADIRDMVLIVLVVRVGHRRDVYQR